MLGQQFGNLLQLDPISANFDLVVDAAQTQHLAVRAPFSHIPCAVHHLTRLERVRNELRFRQIRPVAIPASQSVTGNAQLARRPNRLQPHPFIDDIKPGVIERFPDCDGLWPL
ncbi:hypothetical protein D3C81_1895730 [compost metagenome]